MSAEQSQNPYAAPRANVDDAAIASAAPAGPRGIGGWLILPLLGLIFTPFRIGLQLVRDVLPVLKPGTWHAVTTPGTAAYHPMWAPLIVYEVGANCVLIAFSVALLWLFFRKSKRVPVLMVVWLLANPIAQMIDMLLAQQIPAVAALPGNDGLKELGRSVVGLLVWVPYFLVSTRVKNTFVA